EVAYLHLFTERLRYIFLCLWIEKTQCHLVGSADSEEMSRPNILLISEVRKRLNKARPICHADDICRADLFGRPRCPFAKFFHLSNLSIHCTNNRKYPTVLPRGKRADNKHRFGGSCLHKSVQGVSVSHCYRSTLTPSDRLRPGSGARYFRKEFCGRASASSRLFPET